MKSPLIPKGGTSAKVEFKEEVSPFPNLFPLWELGG